MSSSGTPSLFWMASFRSARVAPSATSTRSRPSLQAQKEIEFNAMIHLGGKNQRKCSSPMTRGEKTHLLRNRTIIERSERPKYAFRTRTGA